MCTLLDWTARTVLLYYDWYNVSEPLRGLLHQETTDFQHPAIIFGASCCARGPESNDDVKRHYEVWMYIFDNFFWRFVTYWWNVVSWEKLFLLFIIMASTRFFCDAKGFPQLRKCNVVQFAPGYVCVSECESNSVKMTRSNSVKVT